MKFLKEHTFFRRGHLSPEVGRCRCRDNFPLNPGFSGAIKGLPFRPTVRRHGEGLLLLPVELLRRRR
ncbi:unnamed protein product, partial [Iphiclides podalirius]